MDDLKEISNRFIESYKSLEIEDKKRELLERVKLLSDNYREICNAKFGVNNNFVTENIGNINNDEELLNALFAYVIEIDNQVGVIVENTIK